MASWNFLPVGDHKFHDGMAEMSDRKLKDVYEYLKRVKAAGFHVTDRIRAVRQELDRRKRESGAGDYGL